MLIVKSFCFNPFSENTYIVQAPDGTCAILDPGCYQTGERSELESYIRTHGLTPVLFLNTHCHLDHIFGNNFVHQTWSLPLLMHPNEQLVLDYASVAGTMYQVPCENYVGTTRYLQEGDRWQLGDEEVICLFTPGHSPGSCIIKIENNLFSGDIFYKNGLGAGSVPKENTELLKQSILKTFDIFVDEDLVLPGHGASGYLGGIKNNNEELKNFLV